MRHRKTKIAAATCFFDASCAYYTLMNAVMFSGSSCEKTGNPILLISSRRWEDAVHVTRYTAGEFQVRRWLAAASSNLAIEAFFPVAEGLAFPGVRLAVLPHALQHEIVLDLVSVFAKFPEMSITAWIEKMESFVGDALKSIDLYPPDQEYPCL